MSKDIYKGREWYVWTDKGHTFRKHLESGNTWIMNKKGEWVPYKTPEDIANKILDDLRSAGIYTSPFV